MWMMTRYGMYSIVNNPDDPEFEVQIRARVRSDLENLQQRFGSLLKPYQIWETPNADYACRIIMPQHEFALLSFLLAGDIDYDNFKAEVERTDPKRAVIYHRVWAILLNALQPQHAWATLQPGYAPLDLNDVVPDYIRVSRKRKRKNNRKKRRNTQDRC